MKKLLSLALALVLLCSIIAQAETFIFEDAGYQIEIPEEWMSFTGEFLSAMGMELPIEQEIDGVTVNTDVRLMAFDAFGGSILIDMVAAVPDEAYLAEIFDEFKNTLLSGMLDELTGISTEEIQMTDAQWSETVFLDNPAVLISIGARHSTEGFVYMEILLVKFADNIEEIVLVSPDAEVPAKMQGWFLPIGEATPAVPETPSSQSNAA